jgi:hypothetical protein
MKKLSRPILKLRGGLQQCNARLIERRRLAPIFSSNRHQPARGGQNMNKKSIFLALVLTATVSISATVLRAQSSEPPTSGEGELAQALSFNGQCDWLCQLRERQAQQLEGSWAVTVTPVPPPGAPPLPDRFIYLTMARGGAVFGSDRGLPFASPQHGVWEHRGGSEFAYITVQDLFDAAGNFQGTLKVKSRIIVTGPNQFVAVSNPQIRDAAGNLILDGCSTSKAVRIKTEPLLERCQSITPPE